jgi:hypothetical protein
MDRLCFPGFPVQKPAVSDHRRGRPDPGRRVRGGDEEDHQASSQVRTVFINNQILSKNCSKKNIFFKCYSFLLEYILRLSGFLTDFCY